MLSTPALVLFWVQTFIALAVILQTVELLMGRHAYSESGAWRWSFIREDYKKLPLLRVLDFLLAYPMFLGVLTSRLLFALIALFSTHPAWPLGLLLTTLLITIRWRGSFNGGSDAMTVVILTALVIARLFPGSETVQLGALWYIAIQAGLSYFVAGWCKIGKSSWRSGQALRSVFQASPYCESTTLNHIASQPAVCFSLAASTLFFECSFPIAFFSPALCSLYLLFAAIFHLTNVYILGLNRFVFAWIASFPAIYYCSRMIN